MMRSFWEMESLLACDFAVVGAGIIGLSTALSLKERHPSASVFVLERDVLPTGASTRNVGFLSVSTLSEVVSDRESLGAETLAANLLRRKEGIALLLSRLGAQSVGYEATGGYELLMDKDLGLLDRLAEVNRWLRPIFPTDVFSVRDDLLDRFGFPRKVVRKLIHNPYDGQVHTGKLMYALASLAQQSGVRLITGAEVRMLQEEPSSVSLLVKARGDEPLEFRAGQVVVCTNAWITRLLPDVRITPARGQVFLTEPVPSLPWRGTFNFDEGYFYFRNLGNRAIVGGGRHTDRETETSHAFELNPGIQARLEKLLEEVILPGQKPGIAQRWAGIMGFSEPRVPIVRRLSARSAVGFGCNSMGIAMGSVIGRDTAALFD